jgi:hypothetical protein
MRAVALRAAILLLKERSASVSAQAFDTSKNGRAALSKECPHGDIGNVENWGWRWARRS